MSLLSKLTARSRSASIPTTAIPNTAIPSTAIPTNSAHAAEVEHWNAVAKRVAAGERLFWLSHPRVNHLHYEHAKLDGLNWREWLLRQWNGPGETALELGCGQGLTLQAFIHEGLARQGVGMDLDDSRFKRVNGSTNVQFQAADVNRVELARNKYDLIYSLQSFHHFEALEHIMEEVHGALTDRGFFVLDEFVGPRRFQWTDLQLSVVADLLALMPKPLRMYASGIEKAAEGRSTPEEVIRVCPSEAIRSDEIVPLFYRYFDVVAERKLGGTLQHLLYSGIAQNFPDNIPEIDRMIDGIDRIERRMIDCGLLTSDFVLLIGKKKAARV